MKDVLYEESFNPTNFKFHKTIYVIYSVLFWVFMVAAFIVFALLFFIPAWFLFAFLVLSAVAFWYLRTKVYYCIDLVFVSGHTRIVKVVNYKYRKKMLLFDYEEVTTIGKIGSETFEKIAATPKIKKIFATPNRYIENGYYVSLIKDGVNYLVLLECKEDYLVNLVNFAGRKIIEKDFK